MTDKVKITFVVPLNLQTELKGKIAQDGYDMKGKSRWVAEAIEGLLQLKSFPELIKINDSMQGFEKFESIVVRKELKKQMDEAVIEVRKAYPEIEGVVSRMVRTAIVQRLIKGKS